MVNLLSSLFCQNVLVVTISLEFRHSTVRKVKMDSDEPPSGCSFPSPKLPRIPPSGCSFPSLKIPRIPPSGCTPKLPRIDYGSYRRRFSSLRSDLSSGLKSTRKHYLQPRVLQNDSFSHQSLACLDAGGKRIKQGSSFLKTRTNTLCNRSSSYEIVQGMQIFCTV